MVNVPERSLHCSCSITLSDRSENREMPGEPEHRCGTVTAMLRRGERHTMFSRAWCPIRGGGGDCVRTVVGITLLLSREKERTTTVRIWTV